MRFLAPFLAVIMIFGLATSPLRADTTAAGIETVITGQIQAFQRDDFEQAFTYASPSIRRMFGSSQNFGAMVRNGYPMVWRPDSVRFAELREIAGAMWQKVIIQDQNGGLHALDYRMVQIDGNWRISAVQILQAPELSV